MKLAYLANIPYPSDRAHAAQITHMCQAFASNDCDVTLFANAYTKASLADVSAKFGLQPKFALTQLPLRSFWYRVIDSFHAREFLFALLFWWKYRSDNFDIVYSRHELVLYVLSWLLPRTTLVYESHEAKYNVAAKRLLRRAMPIVVISQGIYDFYIEQGVSATQLLVADDGIDESFFAAVPSQATMRNRLGLPADAFIAMYIGGFASWKGIDTFCAAAAEAPDVHFVAIGGSAEQVAAAKEKYPQVTFPGQLPYRDLRDNQQSADVLVIPNTATTPLSSRYTSPLKLFAHMASGVPLVVSDIPSLTSVVSADDVTLVTPDSAQALAAGILSIQQQPSAHRTTARQLAIKAQQYTWTERAKKILLFINSFNEKNN